MTIQSDESLASLDQETSEPTLAIGLERSKRR